MRSARILVLGALLPLGGCSEPPDLSPDIETYASRINASRSALCLCPQDVGYPGVLECQDGLGRVDVAGEQCIADALEGSEDAGKEYLDCANAAYADYVACLEVNETCEDGWIDGCNADHTSALSSCTPLAQGFDPAFATCGV